MTTIRSFSGPVAAEWIDSRQDYGEQRIILLGMTTGEC